MLADNLLSFSKCTWHIHFENKQRNIVSFLITTIIKNIYYYLDQLHIHELEICIAYHRHRAFDSNLRLFY